MPLNSQTCVDLCSVVFVLPERAPDDFIAGFVWPTPTALAWISEPCFTWNHKKKAKQLPVLVLLQALWGVAFLACLVTIVGILAGFFFVHLQCLHYAYMPRIGLVVPTLRDTNAMKPEPKIAGFNQMFVRSFDILSDIPAICKPHPRGTKSKVQPVQACGAYGFAPSAQTPYPTQV